MKRRLLLSLLALVLLVGGIVIHKHRPWPRAAWDAADHNRDGVLTKAEMLTFSQQAPHRNGPRLMMHFDRADTNHDQVVDANEVDACGTAIGSRDPYDHLPPGQFVSGIESS